MIGDKYIILDRDGVINYATQDFIKPPDEWKPLPGSLRAIKKLCDYGYQIVIITNQSGIGRGLIKPDDFLAINNKLFTEVEKVGGQISSILYSPSLPNEDSIYRKPNIGMFLEASKRLNFDLSACYSIGDSPRDIEASVNAQCIPMGVLTGNGKKIKSNNIYNVQLFKNLDAAVDYITSK